MTDPMARAREMAEKLRAQVGSGRRTLGGGSLCVSTDGKTTAATMWGGEPIMVYRNPDGPDAANLIDELLALLTREAEVRGEERERAARIAEDNRTDDDSMWDRAAATIATAIRDGATGGDGMGRVDSTRTERTSVEHGHHHHRSEHDPLDR